MGVSNSVHSALLLVALLFCVHLRLVPAMTNNDMLLRIHQEEDEASWAYPHAAGNTLLEDRIWDGGGHNLTSLFNELDVVVNQNLDVLYPKEGGTEDAGTEIQQQQYDAWAQDNRVQTICETGFNAGHSALRFLAMSSAKAKVYEFDMGSHNYSHPSAALLQKWFPERLTVTWGDSTKTLPEFVQKNPGVKCDVLVVDGGHQYEVSLSDLISFSKMAATGNRLTIDDTPCNAGYCPGPTQAWEVLKASGCISEDRAQPMGQFRGFKTGRFNHACATPPPNLLTRSRESRP